MRRDKEIILIRLNTLKKMKEKNEKCFMKN